MLPLIIFFLPFFSINNFDFRLNLRLQKSFVNIFELNLSSIKNAVIKDVNSIDLRPHYVTRRYAEFTVSILYLSQSELTSEIAFIKRINQNLSRLREEMEKLLVRLAEARYKDWKSKTILLINNYDLILSVYSEREITSVDSIQFTKLMDIKTNDYAQEELRNSFGRLLNFVKENTYLVKDELTSNTTTTTTTNNNNQATPITASTSLTTPITSSTSSDVVTDKKLNVKEEEVDLLLREFNNSWKLELEKINGNISKLFSNFKCGMKVFQTIMEDLLEAYTIFIKIVRKYYKNLRMSKHFIPETEVTYEMKKLFVRFD